MANCEKDSERRILFVVFGALMAIAIGAVAAVDQEKEKKPDEPMVAFVCHLSAMHWTATGWVPDQSTGCLKDHAEIVEYCQKMYGHLPVIDAVESMHLMRISNWCEPGLKKRCNSHSYFVKPFRCLIADSESASKATTSTETNDASTANGLRVSPVNPLAEDDAYLHFIRNVPETNLSEHEYYTKARNALRQRHRLKMSKVIEQWKRMNRTAERASSLDRQSAEEFQKQITTRLQKLYEALLQEEKYEDRQLNELHQQRVQAELNQLKHDALDSFMKAIRSEPTDTSLILKTLKNYVRAEERDSEHTVARFIHIRRKDPHEAETVSSYVIEHLKIIDKRIRQSLVMLDRVPKHKKSILRLIEPFLRQFDSLDENIASMNGTIVNMNISTNDVTKGTVDDVRSRSTTWEPRILMESLRNDIGKEKKKEKELKTNQVNKNSNSLSNEVIADYMTTPDAMTTVDMTTRDVTKETKSQNVGSTHSTKADAGVKVKSGIMHKVKLDHVAFMQKNEYHLNEMNIDMKDNKSIKEPSSFLATPIGMTLFSIALVMLIAAALIILHRKVRSSTPVTVGGAGGRGSSRTPRFLVARKQSTKWSKGGASNGYENPTYRYLNSTAKA